MKRLILPGVVLFLCTAIFGLVYLKQQPGRQTVQTADTKAAEKIIFPNTPEDFAISTAVSIISYQNTKYGFDFNLPDSWKNYGIVLENWEGKAVGDKTVQTGTVILIRHPQWAEKNPRQDIPIMVFTIAQWNSLQAGNFHIGAAPMNPSELGRNSRYVFALPARYNYAFPTGYEEVETIVKNKPLQPTENFQ